MKKIVLLFLSLSAIDLLFAQDAEITLQPDSICGKDAMVWNAPGHNNGTTNYGSNDAFGANAWTNQGTPDTTRSLLQFDLNRIPQGSTINSAQLSLYNNPTTTFAQGQHSTQSGPNDLYIQRITSAWSEHTVTWFTQPTATLLNQVSVPPSTSAHQDFPNIDVTALVQDMVDNPGSSFGFMIRLQDETYFRDMVFATSDYSVANKRPMLSIHYTMPESGCFVFQPQEGCGNDAMVWNAPPFNNGTTNYGLHEALGVNAWTNSGTPDTTRSLLNFPLDVIPANSIISSAHLSLYNNPNTQFAQGQHSTMSGPNSALIQRITTSWDERTVTWMTQPASTTQNQVLIPASVTAHQDYPNIDVTQLVKDMINDPSNSFGFMIRLETEEYFRDLVFASNNEPDQTKGPKLEICFTPDAVPENHNIPFNIYPNPAHHSVFVQAKRNTTEDYTVSVVNLLGEEISPSFIIYEKMEIPLQNCSPGIYFLKFTGSQGIYAKKLVVN